MPGRRRRAPATRRRAADGRGEAARGRPAASSGRSPGGARASRSWERRATERCGAAEANDFFTQYMYPCWAGPRVCRAIPVQPTGSAYGCVWWCAVQLLLGLVATSGTGGTRGWPAGATAP